MQTVHKSSVYTVFKQLQRNISCVHCETWKFQTIIHTCWNLEIIFMCSLVLSFDIFFKIKVFLVAAKLYTTLRKRRKWPDCVLYCLIEIKCFPKSWALKIISKLDINTKFMFSAVRIDSRLIWLYPHEHVSTRRILFQYKIFSHCVMKSKNMPWNIYFNLKGFSYDGEVISRYRGPSL